MAYRIGWEGEETDFRLSFQECLPGPHGRAGHQGSSYLSCSHEMACQKGSVQTHTATDVGRRLPRENLTLLAMMLAETAEAWPPPSQSLLSKMLPSTSHPASSDGQHLGHIAARESGKCHFNLPVSAVQEDRCGDMGR